MRALAATLLVLLALPAAPLAAHRGADAAGRARPDRQHAAGPGHGGLRPVIAAADSVDTTVFAAFAVGFVSFISPCVLPLVPGYLSAVSGVSPNQLKEGEG